MMFGCLFDEMKIYIETLPERSNWRGSESCTMENDVYVWRYALILVHARHDDDDDDDDIIDMLRKPPLASVSMLEKNWTTPAWLLTPM